MRKLLNLLPLCAIVACVSAGHQVTESDLQQFQVGKSTVTDVLNALGQPTGNYISSAGGRTFIYSYTHAQARPDTFIPIVGGLVGGSDTSSNVVTLNFDKDGILTNYTSGSTSQGMANNLASGVPTSRTPVTQSSSQ
jgi:outer membrane protein assembly factor BamE (lipoprotein component of BamABCDE complex)